jgi:hypothetical protein
MSRKDTWTALLAAPRDFAHGFLGGLFGPLLALAAAIGLTYVATQKLPAVKEVTKNDGTRHRALSLAPPLEARASWARTAGDLRSAVLELRAQMQRRG